MAGISADIALKQPFDPRAMLVAIRSLSQGEVLLVEPLHQSFEDLLAYLEGVRRELDGAPPLGHERLSAVVADLSRQIQDRSKSARHSARVSALLSDLTHRITDLQVDFPAVIGVITRIISEATGEACVIRMGSIDEQQQDQLAFHYHNLEALSFIRALVNNMPSTSHQTLHDAENPVDLPHLMPEVSLDLLKRYVPEDYWPWIEQFPIRSVMVVALNSHNRLIGVLALVRYEADDPFDEVDLAFLMELANRVALAIENTRLRSEERQRMRELNALQTATSALLTTIDLEVMLARILDSAQSAIPVAERGSLHLHQKEGEDLQVRAISGAGPTVTTITDLHLSKDICSLAVREKRPLLLQDTRAEIPETGGQVSSPPGQLRSAIVAPLIAGTQVFGAVFLAASRPFAFTGADLRLLVSFAATATEALQNAMLYSEVQRLATTDTLTEQFNRRRFFELGYREIERFNRFGHPLSAIMLDVDNLKEVNDNFGHASGDQVLHAVAKRCQANIRQIDILGRYGGDEFAIMLPNTDLFLAIEIADRIRRSVIDTPVETDRGEVRVSMSLGVAQISNTAPTLSALLDRADAALYSAKEKGRNRVEVG